MPVQVTQGGGVPEPEQDRKRGAPVPAAEPSPEIQLAERAREVPMGLVQRHPGLALRLMMGAMPKRQLGEVARAADAVTTWVAQRESFAGIPGSLAAVRYTILSRVPAERRDAALAVLDELQRLPRDQQGPLMLALQQALASGSATVPPVITQALAARGALTPEVEAALAEAFQPSGPGTVGTAIHDWLELVPERPGTAAGQLLAAPFQVAGAAGGGLLRAFHLGGVAAAAGAAARGLETAFSKAVAGVADVLASPVVLTKGYKWPHETSEPFGTLIDYYTNAAVANGFRSLDPEQRAVEDALALAQKDQQAGRLLGVETNQQTGQPSLYSERMRNVMDFVAQWVVAGKIAKTAAALKTARAVPREMLPPATGVIEDTLYRIASKGVEDFVNTRRGKRLIDDVIKTTSAHPDAPVAALLERFRGMPPELAEKLAYGSAAERARRLVDYVTEGPTQEGLAKIKTRLAEIDGDLERTLKTHPEPSAPRLGMVEAHVNNLLAERRTLQTKVGELIHREPLYTWPKASFVRAVVRDAPATRLENVMAALHRGFRARLSRLVDDLPEHPEIWLPTASSKPMDWASQNVAVIGDYLRRAGTPTATIRRVTEEMLNAKTEAAAFEWLTKSIPDAIAEGLTRGKYAHVEAARAAVRRGEFRGLDLQTFDEVTRIFRNSADEIEHSRIHTVAGSHPTTGDSIRVAEPAMWVERDGLKRAVPSQPNEFIERVVLPSVERLTEADSLISRTLKAAKAYRPKIGGIDVPLGKAALFPVYTLPRQVLKVATTVFKPAILGPRVVAMSLRIQMEQVARMAAFGYRPSEMFLALAGGAAKVASRTPLPFGLPMPKEMLAYLAERGRVFGEMDATDLGLLWDYGQKGSQGRWIWHSRPEWHTGTVLPTAKEAQLAAQGLHEYVLHLHGDPLVRTLARVGPDRFLQTVAKDDYLSWQFAQLKPLMSEAKLSPEQWVERKWQQLQEVTGGDADMLRAIGTGSWKFKGAVPEELTGRLEILRADVDAAERALADATAKRESQVVVGELSRNVKKLRDEIGSLEAKVETYGRSISLRDGKPFRKELARRMSQGEWRPPPSIPYREGMLRAEPTTALEHVQRAAQAFGDAFYYPLRYATKADLNLTRGSLYFQVYERTKATLERQRWSPEFAEQAARARAAAITKDIMYDLSARSSLHRALADHSFFLPAAQEVAYTWLVKIPSRYYWPVGAGYVLFRAEQLLQLLRDTGIIRKDPYGQDMLMAPWVTGLLRKFGLEVPDTAFGRPESLNLVLQGLPSLSPIQNAVLGKLARDHGGVIKALSDVLQPYGPDVSIWPTWFIYGWERAFGEPPPSLFDGGYAKIAYQRTQDQAIQAAYQEMLDEGIKPPRPEQFLTKEKDPRSGQRIVDEAAYKEALQSWWDELQARAQSRLNGLLAIRLFGATVNPFSVQGTEEERLQYQRFWQSLGVTSKSELTDAQREVFDQWLKDHPESIAYAVSYYGPGDGSLPYKDFGEDEFDDKLRAGLIRVLPPEEYIRSIQTWDAYRVFINRVHNCAQKAGATPAEQLRNWSVYSACSRDARYEWERFLTLNPDAEAYLKDNKERWAKLTGEKPKLTFEAERLAELTNLLKESAAYLNEAGVGYEYRAVASALNELATYEKPTSERGKLTAWYFNKVIDPYSAKLKELYDKAEEFRLNSQDDKAARVYDAIRRFKDSQGPVIGPDGERYPSPQVFLWNAMEPEARQQAKLAWASKPVSWLSQFQRARVYRNLGASPQKVTAFLEEIQGINRDYYEALDKLDPAPNSPQREWMDALREKLFSRTADKYGPWARDVLKLELAPPIVRYEAIGYGMDNELWGKMVEAAKFYYEQIKRQGYNPAWYSQFAVERKAYLESVIERYRDPASPDYNRGFARLWEQLQAALPEGNRMRAWIPLYEAVLFGQFRPEPFGQEDLIKAIQGG